MSNGNGLCLNAVMIVRELLVLSIHLVTNIDHIGGC